LIAAARRDLGSHGWLIPPWRDDAVGALMTTRAGGHSSGRYASMNVGLAVGDDAKAVAANRCAIADACGVAPVFLRQVHGVRVARIGRSDVDALEPIEADAAVTTEPEVVCVVQVADCLPVLLAAPDGRAVAAAHAGWRGLASGVLEASVAAICTASGVRPGDLRAWLGACIGQRAFEVGPDVLAAFGADSDNASTGGVGADRRFLAGRPGRWHADLRGLACDRLAALGVVQVSASDECVAADASRFFSYRRDGITGRMAAAIWIRGGR